MVELEIIFFDELIMGFDLIMLGVINDLICEIVIEIGVIVVIIIYDMISVCVIVDNIVMIYGGKVCWMGLVLDMDSVGDFYLD